MMFAYILNIQRQAYNGLTAKFLISEMTRRFLKKHRDPKIFVRTRTYQKAQDKLAASGCVILKGVYLFFFVFVHFSSPNTLKFIFFHILCRLVFCLKDIGVHTYTDIFRERGYRLTF